LQSLNPNVSAALIAAVAAILGLLYTQRQNKAKDIAEAHRADKVLAYRKFMEFISRMLAGSKEGNWPASADGTVSSEFQHEFIAFTSDLIVWGSPDVIKKFEAFRVAANANIGHGLLLAVDDLLQAIRKDLRNSNSGLKRGDLLKLYLRDPSELD
jgi:hypothetical protein